MVIFYYKLTPDKYRDNKNIKFFKTTLEEIENDIPKSTHNNAGEIMIF